MIRFVGALVFLAVFGVAASQPRPAAPLHLRGTVTYLQPGSFLVLQDQNKGYWIETASTASLHPGDVVEVTADSGSRPGSSTLVASHILLTRLRAPIQARAASWAELAGEAEGKRPLGYELVSTEGQIVAATQLGEQRQYVLSVGGHLFTAAYRQPAMRLPEPLTQLVPGATVRVTGIAVERGTSAGREAIAFNILMCSLDDMVVVGEPFWFNLRNLASLTILLLLAVIAVGFWALFLLGRMHRQSAVIGAQTEREARLERCRSVILEDINGAKPLGELLTEITEFVSAMLGGAPCLFTLTDGTCLGVASPSTRVLRTIRKEVASRDGQPLGLLSASLEPFSKPSPREEESLEVGARLASLSMECRKLYSDLVRRSEFDLLTDIHNRFSFEKHLDAKIAVCHMAGGRFALIYIDLDKFKPINDKYGHQAGDAYLQQAAERMKNQLRSVDILARLGGDEFAAIVPVLRGRGDVEEIALRLQRAFDDPFAVEQHLIHGSASMGIAFFPDDADSKDRLLDAADEAMYQTKNNKRQVRKLLDESIGVAMTASERDEMERLL